MGGNQSMLPKDAEKCRKDIQAKNQPRLNPHLQEKPQKERTIPYTDKLFCDTAIEWLVSTDQVCKANFLNLYNFSWKSQPIQAFKHLSFWNMINIAARATNGIKIPDCCHTWQAIINKFKQQLAALRDRLNVREILQHSYFFF